MAAMAADWALAPLHGHANANCCFSLVTGKTYTMVGSPEATCTLGVIPCAISWLFRGISEQKQKTGARFSVRVSAVEVVQQSGGTSQQLKDLLAGHASGMSVDWRGACTCLCPQIHYLRLHVSLQTNELV
jgi:kinesin family protein 26